VADRLLNIAEQNQDQVLIVEGHYALGVALFYPGHYVQSRAHLEQAIAHYDPQVANVHITLYAQDPKAVCLIRLALDLWCLGYLDQAAQAGQAALAYARELAHPFSLAYCLVWDAILQSLQGNSQATQAQAEAAMAISRDHHLRLWSSAGLALHGWAMAVRGEIDTGMAELHEGIAALHASNTYQLDPHLLALLAELYLKAGNVEQSQNLLTETLALVDESAQHWYESELYRRQGKLLQLRSEEAKAEVAFRRSISIAQSQQAKSLELRAATSLAQLWHTTGRSLAAKQLLTPLYGGFTEGFDTPDLLTARSLISQL
jgi:predicted ATPase